MKVEGLIGLSGSESDLMQGVPAKMLEYSITSGAGLTEGSEPAIDEVNLVKDDTVVPRVLNCSCV